MNNLSWMLYLADVVGGLKATAGMLAVVAAIVSGCTTVFYLSGDGEGMKKVAKQSFIAFIPLLFVCLLTPSRETVYAVAASEAGEAALNSNTGNKAIEALNSWLDRQIKEDKGE